MPDYTVTLVGYVEEDQEAQGPDAPLQGEPRQAPQHGPRLRPHDLQILRRDDVVDLRPADTA